MIGRPQADYLGAGMPLLDPLLEAVPSKLLGAELVGAIGAELVLPTVGFIPPDIGAALEVPPAPVPPPAGPPEL